MDDLKTPAKVMDDLIKAHAAEKAEDLMRLRALTMEDRSAMIESACAAAMEIERGRIASGLPPSTPAPWPASTWEFLRRHAARVRR
jgi:hypothetical protein